MKFEGTLDSKDGLITAAAFTKNSKDPWIAVGEWNTTLEDLASSTWLHQLDASIRKPDGASYT